MQLFPISKYLFATFMMCPMSVALVFPSEEIYNPSNRNCSQNFENKIADCRKSSLTKVPRNLNPDLQTLFLSENELKTLRNTSFERYPRLTELYLDSNGMDTIESCTFFPLRDLKILILSRNSISVISGGLFKRNENLQQLHLSQNKLEVFSSEILKFLPNLQFLSLYVNSIRVLNITNCDRSTIQGVNLMNNNFQKLTSETFTFTCATNSLYLDFNSIITIDPQTIASLSVKMLQLGGLPFFTDKLLKDLFLGVSLSMIEEVWINAAYISIISEDLFDALQDKALRMISLRQNKLQLYHSVFSKLKLLSALDISDCNLKMIEPEYFEGMIGLQHLYLNNNMIAVINPYNSLWKINLYHLDLSRNVLHRINQSSFSGLFNLTSMSLRRLDSELPPILYIDLRNILSIDFSRSIIRKLKLTTPLLKTLSYGDIQERQYSPFYNRHIFQTAIDIETIHLASAQLTLDDIWHIDDRSSLFKDLHKLTHLNISYNNFQALPSPVLKSLFSLQVLDIGNCNIKVIQARTFHNLTSLRILNLKNNDLLSIPTHLLANMNNLVNLHLDSNSLGYLDEIFFLNLKMLSNLTLANNRLVGFNRSTFDPILSSVRSIDISGNLIMCNCDTKWLVEQLGDFLTHENDTMCSTTSATLEPLRGMPLTLFKPNLYCRIDITLYCLISVGVLGLCITLVISYHNRWLLKYKLFLLKLAVLGYREIQDARNNDDFEYDINIMFLDNDKEWAREVFRPALQERVPNFERIAFGDDSLVLGMHYFDAVYYNVENSFKSVLLISREAVRDHIFITKCRIAMNHVTDTQIENIILVFLEDIPDEEMPYFVKLYLSGQGIYLSWEEDEDGQECFWNKLIKCLTVNLRINHLVPPE